MNSWSWFIYTRTHNVNKRSDKLKDDVPLSKKVKVSYNKHYYPSIPHSSGNIESNRRNLALLREESLKPCHEAMKTLLTRTHSFRREIHLRRLSFSQEMLFCMFKLFRLHWSSLSEAFEMNLIFWSKAITTYCATT